MKNKYGIDLAIPDKRADARHPVQKGVSAAIPIWRLFMGGNCVLAIAFWFCVGLTASAQIQPQNRFVTFDVPSADETSPNAGTFPCCINTAGMIAGIYVDANGLQHGFVRSPNGHITTFDVPNSTQIFAIHGVNEFGMITGEYFDTESLVHGFLRTPNGQFATFDGPGAGPLPGLGTQARSINQFGVIAGDYWDENYVAHGFVRTLDGKITKFDAPGAGTTAGSFQGTYINSINLWGTLSGGYVDSTGVGHQFVRIPNGTFATYDAPDAGPGLTLSTSLNTVGTVAGHYFDANFLPHGFVRTQGGQITEFDPPDSIVGTYANGINPFGVVVGFYGDQSYAWHGYLRTAGGRFVTFGAPGAGTGYGEGTGAPCVGNFVQFVPCIAINSKGVITGSFVDANNGAHGFIRLPVLLNREKDE